MEVQDKKGDLLLLAENHQNLCKLLTCSICLDILMSPCKTKCGHIFCSSCIEDHIRKGKRKVLCPLCNTSGLTKRSLEPELFISKLVSLFRKLLEAEKLDTCGDIDFLNIRVNRAGARESIGSPKTKASTGSKWTPVKEKKVPDLRKEVWHQNKKKDARTYSRDKQVRGKYFFASLLQFIRSREFNKQHK